MFVNVFSTVLW